MIKVVSSENWCYSTGMSCGAEYYFVDLDGLHLVYTFFPFLVIMTQLIGEESSGRIGKAE